MKAHMTNRATSAATIILYLFNSVCEVHWVERNVPNSSELAHIVYMFILNTKKVPDDTSSVCVCVCVCVYAHTKLLENCTCT